ncbi:hypothetical protein SDC9_81255 [bioreactor metagenome]|uniref:Uncharacterized protein n=1 Tax=bioreactor metagenome TaxID=1076179 RepID=A0A644Z316_9ZZZZ
MRVFARQQTHQQLVEVHAREQRVARRHDVAARPFRALERVDVAVPLARDGVGHPQRLQRQQHGAKIGGGLFRALGHQSHATIVAREHFQDQAGLAPVVLMEDERRFIADALGGHGGLCKELKSANA